MKDVVGSWLNVARAYEIALLGNFSIEIVYDDDYHNINDDYELIKEYYTEVLFKSNSDMMVQIYKPEPIFDHFKPETKNEIIERVKVSMNNQEPDDKLDNACNSLLQNVCVKKGLSLNQLNKIKNIALVIAKLDNSKNIECYHLAEAIQYQLKPLNVLSVENVKFGNGICISKNLHSVDDIKNAIEYLKNLL